MYLSLFVDFYQHFYADCKQIVSARFLRMHLTHRSDPIDENQPDQDHGINFQSSVDDDNDDNDDNDDDGRAEEEYRDTPRQS